MAASLVVTLDTTPPQLTLGQAYLVGQELHVPYWVDEPALIDAQFANGGALIKTDTELIGTLADAGSGRIQALTRDGVFNERAWDITFDAAAGVELGRATQGDIVRVSKIVAALTRNGRRTFGKLGRIVRGGGRF